MPTGMLRSVLLAAAIVGGCHNDPPVQTAESDDTPIGTESGNRLQPAPDRFSEGCDTDADCTIQEDPCGYAQAVLTEEREEYQESFEGVDYDCPRVEYAAPPVARCDSGRCVGRVPGG